MNKMGYSKIFAGAALLVLVAAAIVIGMGGLAADEAPAPVVSAVADATTITVYKSPT